MKKLPHERKQATKNGGLLHWIGKMRGYGQLVTSWNTLTLPIPEAKSQPLAVP